MFGFKEYTIYLDIIFVILNVQRKTNIWTGILKVYIEKGENQTW